MTYRTGLLLTLCVALALPMATAMAEPNIVSLDWEARGNDYVTLVDVTFTFTHPDNAECWIALWGHDEVTREHFPMQRFLQGDVANQRFAPGTHTLTWVAGANAGGRQSDNFQVYLRISDQGRVAAGQYLVIDVSEGPDAEHYPVEYVDNIDVTRDEFKTDKIVLRELPDGSYAGVFQVTQQQYEHVTGTNPSNMRGIMRPVERVSWDMITGSGNYEEGIISSLRETTNLINIDIPTIEASEYAGRAGSSLDYNDYTINAGLGADYGGNDPDPVLDNLGWYWSNSGNVHHVVGGKQPNAWGLYDTHGNTWEWTATRIGTDSTYRGGSRNHVASKSIASHFEQNPSHPSSDIGHRISCPTPQPIGHPSFTQQATSAAPLGLIATGDIPDPEMLPVPAGSFQMGRPYEWDPEWGEERTNELPVHEVYLDEYEIGKYPVTNQEFADVLNWALAQGYLTNSSGGAYTGGRVYAYGQPVADTQSSHSSSQITYSEGRFDVRSRTGHGGVVYSMNSHPVVMVSWYGSAAFANWLSEMQGLQPCYNTTNWERYTPVRNGYRLPTEAEWERAAAWDSSTGKHYIYGVSSDTIDSTNANFRPDGVRVNPLGLTSEPPTSPVGWFNGVNISPNGNVQTIDSKSPVGAYDMAGNVLEWCHDRSLRAYSSEAINNPIGPATGSARLLRGGMWRVDVSCRSADRSYSGAAHGVPTRLDDICGMRLARTPDRQHEELTIMLPGDVPLTLVRIPAGSFEMGAPDDERGRRTEVEEGPVRTVNIEYDFYMGKYAITQSQWLAVMGSWPGTAPSAARGLGDNYPAYYISWNDTQNFITALNAHIVSSGQGPLTVRLPSEAEWEYSCRAGTTTRFYFGDSLDCADGPDDCAAGTLPGNRSDYMWYSGNNSPGGSKPVGGKLPNAFGLYDMHGNIGEWCEDDAAEDYTGAPTDGSARVGSPRAPGRAVRSGNWSFDAVNCRSAWKTLGSAWYRPDTVGFRLAADYFTESEGESEGEVEGEVEGEGEGEFPLEELTIMLPDDVPLTLVRIPGGTYLRGAYPGEQDANTDREEPQHEVTLTQDFYLGKYVVTQAQWLAVRGSWPGIAPSAAYGVGNKHPAYYISWNDTQDFILALNSHLFNTGQGAMTMRLPTEAEWEYAARAGTTTRFYWGDDLDYTQINDYAWYFGNNSPDGTKPVGQKYPNFLGLYDMSGNVWEWCQDWSGIYPSNSVTDPTGPSTGTYRTPRGGGWYSEPRYCRLAYRGQALLDERTAYLGFRLAADYSPHNPCEPDDVPPTLTLTGAAEVTVECGDSYTDAGATAWDACDGDITESIVTDNPVDSSVPGVYTVRYNVSDAAGNAAEEVTRTVTVVDTLAPEITQCASDRSVEADGDCAAVVPDFTVDIVAEDSCTSAEDLVITQSPAAGATVSAGVHTVTITVTDSANNETQCAAVFTVFETTSPVITRCPAPQSASADGACEAAVPDFTAEVEATDNCPAATDLVITQTPEAGALVGPGTHTVVITVADASGNTDQCETTFTVTDDTGPVITIAGGDTLSGECGVALILPEVTAEDGCDGPVTVTLETLDGLDLPHPTVGEYALVYHAMDDAGNESRATLAVTVSDTVAPVITQCAADAQVDADERCEAVVPDFTGGVIAEDDCAASDALTIAQSPEAGTVVGPGAHTITITVTDASGNTASCAAVFEVVETQAPVITACPEPQTITIPLGDAATLPDLTDLVSAEDNCTPADRLTITQSPRPGDAVGAGAHPLTFTVTDDAGNASLCETTVTVAAYRYGDVNMDGRIDEDDIFAIITLYGQTEPFTADVTHDGVIDRADMLLLTAYVRAGGIVTERPSGLTAQSGVDEITLLWEPVPHDNVADYVVERRRDGDADWTRVAVVVDPVYYDKDIETATYQYRVAVRDILGNVEPFSEPVEVLGNTLVLFAPMAWGGPGDLVYAPISLGSTRGLVPQTMTLRLNYDASVAEAVSDEDVLKTALTARTQVSTFYTPGRVSIVLDDPDERLIGGEGRFLDVPLRIREDAPEGATPLVLSDISIVDRDELPIANTAVDGALAVGDARWGDLDGDGVVTEADAMLALQIAVKQVTPTPEQLFLGDLNGDRRIDSADAVLILRLARGISINPDQETKRSVAFEKSVSAPRQLTLPETMSAPRGCLVMLPLEIDNAEALAGLDLVISFPRHALECVDARTTSATRQFKLESQLREGFARVSLGEAAPLGPGRKELLQLWFRVKGAATNDANPAPVVRVNYAELKGELGESFRWFTTVERTNSAITILDAGAEPCPDYPEGEGEGEIGYDEGEGEGEGELPEGEDEPEEGEPVEGEGEIPVEGEGEVAGEGEKEGEDAPDDRCGCGWCGGRESKTLHDWLGDWLLVAVGLLTLAALSTKNRPHE